MPRIDWTHFSSNTNYINLYGQGITEMNFLGAPQSLKEINLRGNNIIEMNFLGAPQSLTVINLQNNKITRLVVNSER